MAGRLSRVFAASLIALGAGCSGGDPERGGGIPPEPSTSAIDAEVGDGGRAGAGLGRQAALFFEAHRLDAIEGRPRRARDLYERFVKSPGIDARLEARARFRLAELCRLAGDKRRAEAHLDWLITHASHHPQLARRAEIAMVSLLYPRAGQRSALTRGPPVGFTVLRRVPVAIAQRFREAEKRLIRYVRVRLDLQIHNTEAVLAQKRGALLQAIRAYERLALKAHPNAAAAARFRQGSLHQDYAEALGRVRLPSEFLPKLAQRLYRRVHGESVVHYQKAIESYRAVRGLRGFGTDKWRRPAEALGLRLAKSIRRGQPTKRGP